MLGKKTIALFKTVDILSLASKKKKFFDTINQAPSRYKIKDVINKHQTKFIQSLVNLEEKRRREKYQSQ